MDATSPPIKLMLELSSDADPIAGRLHLDDLDAVGFSGYLELISRLEEIRRTPRLRNARVQLRSSTQNPELTE